MFFFFKDTATTELYTLSLHDALPISWLEVLGEEGVLHREGERWEWIADSYPANAVSLRSVADGNFVVVNHAAQDRKSTRLNSSHVEISYAVFCLKKKTRTIMTFVYLP